MNKWEGRECVFCIESFCGEGELFFGDEDKLDFWSDVEWLGIDKDCFILFNEWVCIWGLSVIILVFFGNLVVVIVFLLVMLCGFVWLLWLDCLVFIISNCVMIFWMI